MTYSDDRRYMTYEQRAADDARYRGTIERAEPAIRTCSCGKTVTHVKGQRVQIDGHPVVCPRACD